MRADNAIYVVSSADLVLNVSNVKSTSVDLTLLSHFRLSHFITSRALMQTVRAQSPIAFVGE